MKKVHELSEEDKKIILERYQSGESAQSIATSFDVEKRGVSNLVEKRGYNRNPRKQLHAPKPRYNNMRNEDKDYRREIARLETELAKAKKELERSQLYARSRDIMIDLAEKHFKINIRKKSGAKQ